MLPETPVLTRLLADEVSEAMGLPRGGWLGRCLHLLLMPALRRFSGLFVECDRIVASEGVPQAAHWLLRQLIGDYQVSGAEHIPAQGPLMIAANHPGTVDSVLVAASVNRSDLQIVAGAIPFLQHLPNIRHHLIFAPANDLPARAGVVRQAIRHLQGGGSLLIFARGQIEPDPAHGPEAAEELPRWSRSLEVLLRHVPDTRALVAVIGGVVHPPYMRHPITWLRRARADRQRLAMVMQVIHQMLGKTIEVRPWISFGQVHTHQSTGDLGHALEALLESARRLLALHLVAGTDQSA